MDLSSLSSSHKWFSWSGALGSPSTRQPFEATAPGNGLMGVKNAVQPSLSLRNQRCKKFSNNDVLDAASPEVSLYLLQSPVPGLRHKHDGEHEASGRHGGVHPEHARVAQHWHQVREAPAVEEDGRVAAAGREPGTV